MTGSFRFARLAGIGIYVHWTFLVLLGWIAAGQLLAGNVVMAIEGVALVVALFGCVVLHELGHALVARHYGIGTRDITLLPIGGLARLERIPREPMQELWVALAGPAVNVVLALVLFSGLSLAGALVPPEAIAHGGGSFWSRLFYLNVAMAVFNMVPAFPLDGGRVLRALLARRREYLRATQIAATVGQAMAIVLGIAGLFFNWFLMFIAFFVYVGAQQEAKNAVTRAALEGVPVAAAMLRRFVALDASQPLRDAGAELLAGGQQDFPVLANGRLLGMLGRTKLLEALLRGRGAAPIAEAMTHDTGTADADALLDTVFDRMLSEGSSALPVLRGGELVGVISLENIERWIIMHPAQRGPSSKREAWGIGPPFIEPAHKLQ
jgi:Zn-dependent protease/CBS domain-containing protein